MSVVYCGKCRLPPEYCEFGASLDECKQWLQQEHQELFARLYGQEEIEAKLDGLTVSPDQQSAVDAEKQSNNKKKKKNDDVKRVIITLVERTKRKRVTLISGLEKFDVDLKKASKLFANKFACGASATKNAQGNEEITIQGEFTDDVFDLITQSWPSIAEDDIEFGETRKR